MFGHVFVRMRCLSDDLSSDTLSTSCTHSRHLRESYQHGSDSSVDAVMGDPGDGPDSASPTASQLFGEYINSRLPDIDPTASCRPAGESTPFETPPVSPGSLVELKRTVRGPGPSTRPFRGQAMRLLTEARIMCTKTVDSTLIRVRFGANGLPCNGAGWQISCHSARRCVLMTAEAACQIRGPYLPRLLVSTLLFGG